MAQGMSPRDLKELEASIVEYFFERQLKGHRCGYCVSEDTSMTNGMWAHCLAGRDYQGLIERGWRRCGKYHYKPVMNKTCCPLYAIRCEALRYEPSRSQRKVANKMKAFFMEGREKPAKPKAGGVVGERETTQMEGVSQGEAGGAELEGKREKVSSDEKNELESEGMVTDAPAVLKETLGAAATGSQKKRRIPRQGDGADPSKPPCRKAKEIRLEQRQKKLASSKRAETEAGKVSTCGSNEANAEGLVRQKELQGTVSGAGKSRASRKDNSGKKTVEMLLELPTDQPMAHKLEVRMVPCYPQGNKEFKATFDESYAVYKKYQMVVHGDKEEEITHQSFRRFLCDTPLLAIIGHEGWDLNYGSYHRQYYFDGKLFMVAVMDVLPDYISSVYVYYDPDYRWLELGTYSALHEIAMVRKLRCSKPDFQYYCMGYYIHRNPKMDYKGRFYPSYLLCPDSYHFVPIETAIPKLDTAKYCCLTEKSWQQERVLSFLGGVQIMYAKQVIPYKLFRGYYGRMKDRIVVEYASLVGEAVSHSMLLYMTLSETEDTT